MDFSSIEVNTDNFTKEVINKSTDIPVLVYFYTTWCTFCKELFPRLEKLAGEYDLVLAKVDIEQNRQLAQTYGVESFPDVRLIENGKVIDGFVGALPNLFIVDFLYQNGLQPKDLISGGDGNDTLVGGAENDYFDGGAGDDKISGLKGNDQLYGSSNNDTLIGGADEDYLIGGSGEDYLIGESGSDFLKGESGNDLLRGGSENDLLWGDSGADTLIGGMGDDLLVGVNQFAQNPGQGERDILKGCAGKDTFVLGISGSVFYDDGKLSESGINDYATIIDFTISEDVIYLAEGFNYRLGSSSLTNQSDTGIFIDNSSEIDELIGIIKNVNHQSLDLSNSEQFVFL